MRFSHGLAMAVVLAGLSGCAWDIVDDKMDKMRGLHIGEAIAKLGYPQSDIEVAGRKHYVWSRREVGAYRVPRYETKTVTSYGANGPTTNTYSYTTYESVPYDYQCSLRIFVDDEERILSWDMAGNQGACSTYAWRLSD